MEIRYTVQIQGIASSDDEVAEITAAAEALAEKHGAHFAHVMTAGSKSQAPRVDLAEKIRERKEGLER